VLISPFVFCFQSDAHIKRQLYFKDEFTFGFSVEPSLILTFKLLRSIHISFDFNYRYAIVDGGESYLWANGNYFTLENKSGTTISNFKAALLITLNHTIR
jgi:hypothetical protein